MAAKPRRKGASPEGQRLGRGDWIEAAKTALLKGGVHAVKVDLLARALHITRGSFYWHFASRAELLDALLDRWREQNTAPFRAIAGRGGAATERFLEIVRLWLDEREFEPAFDGAIREWARESAAVAAELEKIDQERMAILEEIFVGLGFAQPEAMIRARVTYYHQVGYYTLAVKETRETRDRYLPLYTRILTGLALVAPATETRPPRRAATRQRGGPR